MCGYKRNVTMGALSLFVGLISYWLFRENTHISKVFDFIPHLNSLREWAEPLSNDFTRGYLQDFLWCLSLACGLHIVLNPTKKQVFLCGVIAFCCGAVWECLQHMSLVVGTADFWDVVVYFAASNVYILTNTKEKVL